MPKKFVEFVDMLADAANYDNVHTYLALKRWSRVNYGDNPPFHVSKTLDTLRERFSPEDRERVTSIPKSAARGLAKDSADKPEKPAR